MSGFGQLLPQALEVNEHRMPRSKVRRENGQRRLQHLPGALALPTIGGEGDPGVAVSPNFNPCPRSFIPRT